MTAPVAPPWVPHDREAQRLLARLQRLQLPRVDRSAAAATTNLRELLRKASASTVKVNDGVRVRNDFVCLREPATGASDRSVPPPRDRPPSTRLMGRKGVALRLMLTVLLEAQTRTEPGDRPAGNSRTLSHARGGELAWTDLLATDAEDFGEGATMIDQEDKKRRSLGNGLDALERAGLVFLPNRGEARNIHRGFVLLEETASPPPKSPYAVPRSADDTFVVPTALFTRGWIHVLSDAELAFLLMTFLTYRQAPAGITLIARVRLRQMGIGPETYEAHRMLEKFGLVRITRQAGRSPNGQVANVGRASSKSVTEGRLSWLLA